MLFMVAAVVLNSIVVSLVFALVLHFLGPTGVLAPPYHLNKATSTTYAFRGGFSNIGLACGVFYVHLSVSFSNTGWYRGAALSFKTIVIIFIKVMVLIILFVEIFHIMIIVVEYIVLIYVMLVLLVVGLEVLLYHLNL
jgi:hypothetical protein